MPFNTYWDRSGYQQGGYPQEFRGVVGYVSGLVFGPPGSKAISGGCYFTKYDSMGTGSEGFNPIIPFTLLWSRPSTEPSYPHAWEVAAIIPVGIPAMMHTYAVVFEES